MSRDIENIMREISKSHKEIHAIDNHLSKDILDIKKSVKTIENKLGDMEDKLEQAIEMLNMFTILIADQTNQEIDEYSEEDDEDDEWNPYKTPEDYDFNNNDDEEDN
jgi:predicted  nucleic acid-binding Zn-ribbon protein